MKKRSSSSAPVTLAILLAGSILLTGCGGKVAGNTYTGNGGVVQIEFKSDGKAYVSTGPVSTPCTYSESGKTVTLVCEGDKTQFTIVDFKLSSLPLFDVIPGNCGRPTAVNNLDYFVK